IPPWAALEWERTGWTLLMIPTDTPSSAAARAALWPASPAPITRTSWVGTGADAIAPKPDSALGIHHTSRLLTQRDPRALSSEQGRVLPGPSPLLSGQDPL